MKTLIATAALSLLTLSTIVEAQPQKNQSEVEAQLLASLPTQDFEALGSGSSVTIQSLLASLPTFDENVEVPTSRVNIANLMASLPTFDENVEMPISKINISKLMASLPTMDENTVESVLFDTDTKHLDIKNHQTASRLSEE